MLQSRALTIRLIRLAMAAALIFPILLFLFASWASYRNILALADERLTRSLDIQQEEATKTFQLIDLIMSRAAELVEGLDAATIRADEDRLHSRLADLSHAVSVVQSIWICAPDGRVLATSWMHPPPSQSFSDRDFITAHAQGDNGVYYGQVYPSAFNAEPFFTVSRPVLLDGSTVAILEISVLPSSFF